MPAELDVAVVGGGLAGISAALAAQKLGAVRTNVSLREFFLEACGASFADGPAAAMISGIFAGEPSQLSAPGCFPDLVASAMREGSVVRGMMKMPKTGQRGIFTLRGGL